MSLGVLLDDTMIRQLQIPSDKLNDLYFNAIQHAHRSTSKCYTKSNYWANVNAQGMKVTCSHCEKTFQHINCPHCTERNNFKSADYIEGTITKCYKCNKSFQLMNCTHCQAANI
jgi:hypothetical protein